MTKRCRKWQITINNPLKHNFSRERLLGIARTTSPQYFCICDEIGELGTPHTHLFLFFNNARSFKSIQNAFCDVAHIENALGTAQQNREYIRKEGKWANDEKKETNLIETFYEEGVIPDERQGKRNDNEVLCNLIKDGLSTAEIIKINSNYINKIDTINKFRNLIKQEEYSHVFRNVEVMYISGESRTGKTRYVMDKYNYDVYRVTNYEKYPFDQYEGQEVLVFDDFRSSIPITDMLKYLDGYPISLTARYMNREACYTKVYIISNISIEFQYLREQGVEQEIYKAFLKRLTKGIVVFHKESKEFYRTIELYKLGKSEPFSEEKDD